jgi:MFS family permease
MLAVVVGTIGHLSYLGMVDRVTAIGAYALDGVMSMFAVLAVFDLGARVAPDRIEGGAFAILTSARVVAVLSAGVVGGWLYEIVGLHTLIAVSAGFTAACAFFICWLPDLPVIRRVPDKLRRISGQNGRHSSARPIDEPVAPV